MMYWFPRDDVMGNFPVWSEYEVFFRFSVVVTVTNMFSVGSLDGSCAGAKSRESERGMSTEIGDFVDRVFFCCILRWPLLVAMDLG